MSPPDAFEIHVRDLNRCLDQEDALEKRDFRDEEDAEADAADLKRDSQEIRELFKEKI